jgi:uncharacterized membrane protein
MSKSDFLLALQKYENLDSINIQDRIGALDTAINNASYNSSGIIVNSSAIEPAFAPIAQYDSELTEINRLLTKYINESAKTIAEVNPISMEEERYNNRVHPEESVASREVTMGIFPTLRSSSVPYIIAVSIFMASISIIMVFQMFGFTGQLSVPQSFMEFFNTPATAIPFYQTPLFLSGISIILLVSVVIFAILYFKAKNTNK